MSCEVAFKHAKHVMTFPIKVGVDGSWVYFGELDANQKCILEVFRSNIKDLSFEDLGKLQDLVYDIIKDDTINSPKWYVYNAIVQRMNYLDQDFTDIHNIIKFQNKVEHQKIDNHQMMHASQHLLADTVSRLHRRLCSQMKNKE